MRDGRRDRREADFFSFGTNDLTQMTFGYCRDAAERSFLLKYVRQRFCPRIRSRHSTMRSSELMRIAVTKGRATKPGLELGICGEHGGDRTRSRKCEQLGLDYVSCSPFRVPVARLAAAQAAIVAGRAQKRAPLALGDLARVAAKHGLPRAARVPRQPKVEPPPKHPTNA